MKLAQLQEARYQTHPAVEKIYELLEELYSNFSYRSTPMRNRHVNYVIRNPGNIHHVLDAIIREFGEPTHTSDETNTVDEWEWELEEWAPDDEQELRHFAFLIRFLSKDPSAPAELQIEEIV
jgi:hypothetical protein